MAAQYPGAAGTDANLFVAANNLSTSLSDNPLSSGATTVNVVSTTGFPTAGYITIEAEAISYTGTTGTSFTGCTRGADGTTAASHITGLSVFHDVVAAHHNVLKDEIKAVESDLVNVMASITPVAAANTATSALQRIAHIVSQIKNGFGLTNWYDVVTAMMPKSGGTFTGAITLGADSAAGGFKWTGLSAGSAAGHSVRFEQLKVLQTVQITSTTAVTATSSGFTSSNLTGSITPTSSSNRILVWVSAPGTVSASASGKLDVTIFRNAVNLALGASTDMLELKNQVASAFTGQVNLCIIDSPATTSSTTYTVKFASDDNTATVGIGYTNGTQVMVLMEIV